MRTEVSGSTEGGTHGDCCAACQARTASDPLTGLADRRLFGERLAAALAEPPGARSTGPAVLLIDLDRFKAVNDTLGHPAGDALLHAAGGRLRSALRADGCVAARLGGDEFAVLLPAAPSRPAVEALATRLLDLLSRPYIVHGRVAVVGASIGAAVAPEDGAEPEPLLRRADLALYASKNGGRGRFSFFATAMQARAEARRQLEQDLRAALPLGQFELHYQPQVDLAADRLSGFEALLRWRHPARGLVPPDAFIPLAEEIGLISAVGGWVLRAACEEAARWPGGLCVAVNVAAPQFETGRLVGAVEEALAASGLPGHRLELELTESALLRHGEATLEQLRALKRLGVQVSLDDFGTGYSSFTQLRSFPFDRVKIDRSFADDAAVVRAVAALGASLGMRTTAEGVETPAQLRRLREDGCTEAQGYLLGRPAPAAALPALIGKLGAGTGPVVIEKVA